MRIASLLAAAGLSALLTAPALAQNAERFVLEKTPEGYVRMDRRTGEMSLCHERAGQLVCKLASDERAAHGEEVERLRAALDALERRVATLEDQPRAALENQLPDEETFDEALGLMERFFRRFMGIVEEFERDLGESEPGTPQRT